MSTSKSILRKAAIYIRVSTVWQVDKESLGVQRRELIAYANMLLGIQDCVVFEDAGYSAKNTDRPDYQKMMARVRTGEFSHLLVWKIDRISRNLLDFAEMYQELKKLGVTFVSKNEQFDTSSAIGEAMLKIILVFAELERNMTSERVSAVLLSRANEGRWNGGRVPYGYDYIKETQEFKPNLPEAAIVQKIYLLYEERQSLIYVGSSLNDAGFRTRKGNDWTPVSIRKILRNPWYIGKYRYNVNLEGTGYKKRPEDEWIEIDNHHEPIIDERLYDRVQFILTRNRRGGVATGKTYTRKNVHVFAGLLKCSQCGSNYSSTLDRRRADGWRPSMYVCSKRRSSKKECTSKYVSDVTLGPMVFNYIANIIQCKDKVKPDTPLQEIAKMLLSGPYLEGYTHICDDALIKTKDLYLSNNTGLEFKPTAVFSASSGSGDERAILLQNKRRLETALTRLRTAYLYDEGDSPDVEYLSERQRILNDLAGIEQQLNKLETNDEFPNYETEEFMAKSSYVVMISQLTGQRDIDYENLVRKLDPSIPKSFVNMIIRSITIDNGVVRSITFTNGVEHRLT